ncbi:MAG TPA: cytochrome c [Acidimicrobiia bacterium]|nr:cytochrome c [Acidimicrobiia bacterium]
MTRVLLTALFLATISACVGRPAAESTGEEIYLRVCANCHGDSLQGALGPSLGPGSNAASQPDDFLTASITLGRGRMPSFQSSLTEDQIGLLVGFIRQEQGQ